MYKDLCFLTHLNRSGSTLLAKGLDQRFNAFVSIEARFVNRIIRNYRLPFDAIEFSKFMNDLYADEKFANWNISKARLDKKFAELSFPISISKIMDTILSEATNGKNYDYCILKSGKYINFYNQLKREFPESKFIFIRRDPRAVFNSLSKTVRSSSTGIMLDDVARFCWSYKTTNNTLSMLKAKDDVFVVEYEDLIRDEDKVFIQVAKFLGIEMKLDEGGYSNRVPEEQQHLHKNINKVGLTERIDAWSEELDSLSIFAIESILEEDLFSQELNRSDRSITHTQFLSFLSIKAKFSFLKLKSRLGAAIGRGSK